VILREEELPVRNCAYTPCFRREAGSYGAHVRGLNRLHQFDKVEIVQVVHPDHSYEVLENMSNYVQSLLQKLELPYRVLSLCGGDMGFTSAKTYDMEVWCAAQARWLEVSSVSNFETYQSNRLKLRFKSRDGKPQLAHTLNGSALALPRIVASLLENNQDEKGNLIPNGFKHKESPSRFCPEDAVAEHKKMLQYIKIVASNLPADRKIVVVGHHTPSPFSVHPKYAHDTLMNGAYSSALDEYIMDHPQIKLWTHGHTHENFDYLIGSTRIVCNPRGYINYEASADNFTLKTVEI
jgi:threonyl-tRNA synthetase